MLQMLPKYIQLIQETALNLDTHVFRGQSDARWPLRSGATRRLNADGVENGGPDFLAEYLDYHRSLLDRARRVIPYGDKDQSSTPLQLLAKLQHFEAATGLLDFTHSPLVALWFACDEPSHDGKVFFLSKELPHTSYVTAELEEGDIGNVLSKAQDPTGPGYLLWEPTVEGDAALRILGQRSVFVIGRPAIDGRHVQAVVINAADKETMREELEQLDVSERTIYRDLVGFCRLERANTRYVPPTTAAAYLRRGNYAFSRGEHSEAIDAYGRCLELGGDQAETYFLRGNANAAAKRYRDAIDDYDEALQSLGLTEVESTSTHYPWFYFAILFNRGNMRACLGEHENAIEDYLRASGVAPRVYRGSFQSRKRALHAAAVRRSRLLLRQRACSGPRIDFRPAQQGTRLDPSGQVRRRRSLLHEDSTRGGTGAQRARTSARVERNPGWSDRLQTKDRGHALGKLREDHASELHGRAAGGGVQGHPRQCGERERRTPPARG